MEYSHEIVRMERGATKGSGSPMWRCATKDGQRVNVFQHSDPVKDSSLLFERAGYLAEMQALEIGEALEWTNSPIQVQMAPDGDWWKVVAVVPRPDGSEPDTLWQPDHLLFRKRAHCQSQQLFRMGFDVLDIESTGLKVDDEIVSIAAIRSEDGEVTLDTLIKPETPSKLYRVQKGGKCAADVHGLTEEVLKDAPGFGEVAEQIRDVLTGSFIVGYNVRYDVDMLDRNLSDHHLEPIYYGAMWDVGQLVSEFIGNWNPKRSWFEMITLEEACNVFGIGRDLSHDAKADALATMKLVKAMADADPETWGSNPFSAKVFA